MNDLSPLDRQLFNWLSGRSNFFLASLPIAVFLGFGLLGILVVSAIAGRLLVGDPYVLWLVASLAIAAVVLYWTTLMVMAVALLRTHRYKLLELHQTMRDIQRMSWHEFEDLVAAFYQTMGYEVEPRGGDAGPDGGIDLILRKGGRIWIVQCKHYRSQWIEEPPLRDLLGVVTAERAEGGIFVTCGVFDERALAFAKRNEKLELIAGEQLRDLIAGAVRRRDPDTKCPRCGSRMRETTGRYGPFLGCSNFPACHGWLPIPAAMKAISAP
jgi:restriction system protein